MPNFIDRRCRFFTIVGRLSRASILYHNHFISFWRRSSQLAAANAGFLIAERLPKKYARFVLLSRTHRPSARCSHLFRRKHGVGWKIEFVRIQTVCIRFVFEKIQNYKQKESNFTSVKPGEKKRMYVIEFKQCYFYVLKQSILFSKVLKKTNFQWSKLNNF